MIANLIQRLINIFTCTLTDTPLAHFMEMDTSSSAGVPDVNSVSMLWPSKALQYNNTYLVAYRGLVNTDGIDIVPSTAFLVCM